MEIVLSGKSVAKKDLDIFDSRKKTIRLLKIRLKSTVVELIMSSKYPLIPKKHSIELEWQKCKFFFVLYLEVS